MSKDRKSNVKKNILVLIILALLVALIGGTYARYSSSATGNGSVQVAKWKVKVNNQDISTQSQTFNLTFTANSDDIVEGKVAPGGTATADVMVDLTDTEVAVDFTCALAEDATSKIEEVFGVGASDRVSISTGTPTLEGGSNMKLSGTTVTLVDNSTAMDGKVKVPVSLKWSNEETKNTEDTKAGSTAGSVTIPVTLTVKQHLAA